MTLLIIAASLTAGFFVNKAIWKMLLHLPRKNAAGAVKGPTLMYQSTIFFVSASSILLAYQTFEWSIAFLTASFLMITGILISAIDIQCHVIPNRLSLLTTSGGLLYVMCQIFVTGEVTLMPLFSVLIGGGFICLLAVTSSMGGGDVKYMAGASLFLSPSLSVLALFIAFISGGIFSIYAMVFSKVKKNAKIAFGPFLVIGICTAFLFGDGFIQAYLSWLQF